MKQTIRLTESDLHNMIMEAINELDWKTYANAAKVARVKGKKWNDYSGNNLRADRFDAQARKQFAKDNGYK